MTASVLIEQFKKLPSRERRKVFAWMDQELAQREDEQARKAAKAVLAKIEAGEPTTPWPQVKKEIGLR
jgi:hypothetical protein